MDLYSKQLGFNPSTMRTSGVYGRQIHLLDNIVEDFKCWHIDRHIIEDGVLPMACSFSSDKYCHLAVADEEGGITILNSNKSGEDAIFHDWKAHSNAIFDIDWTPNERSLLTASGDRNLALFDVETMKAVSQFKGHSASVKSVRYKRDGKFIFASGARDGHIMIWDSRMRSKGGFIPVHDIIQNAHALTSKKGKARQREPQQAVTSVLFQDEYTLLSAGDVDGCIKVWDLRRMYKNSKANPTPKHTFKYAGKTSRKYGFASMIFDSSHTRLFAQCMDSNIYQYDCAGQNAKPVCQYSMKNKHVSFYTRLSLSPDDQYLLGGSDEGHALMWKVEKPTEDPLKLICQPAEESDMSVVAWNPRDFGQIITLDNMSFRIWRTLKPSCKQESGNVVLVGKTERPFKDVAISPKKTVMKTPKKNLRTPSKSKLPHITSPSKTLSPAFKASIASLTQNSNSNLFKHVIMSPNKANLLSPRKLTIKCTPKKQKVVCNSENKVMSAKRKLLDLDDTPDSKRLRADNDGCDPFQSPVRNNILAERNIVDTPKSSKNSPSTLRSSTWSSPTVDLPNYVLNPEPRTPVARRPEKTKAGVDWLTEMRNDKGSPSSSPAATGKATPSPRTTPARKIRRALQKSSPSIRQFFSPKSEK